MPLVAAPITVTSGVYSVTAEHSVQQPSVAFNGPSGVRNFVFAVDLFSELVLGDKGILVLSAELTADPIFYAIDYTASSCNPCFYGIHLYTDAGNAIGRGRVRLRPSDFSPSVPGPPNPYPVPYFGFIRQPTNLGRDAQGMLTGNLTGVSPSLNQPYTWDIMIGTPDPGSAILSGMGLLGLLILRMRRR